MSKIARTYRLNSDDIAYISHVAEENKTDCTKALQKIISDHRAGAQAKTYENTFTRIRLAATGADQNTLILLEMMNTLLVALGKEQHAYTSRIAKSPAWDQCEQEVKRRIAHFKQQKDSKKRNAK